MKEQSNKEDITQEKEITANNDTQIAEKGKSNATPKRYGDDKGGDTGQGGGESGTQPKDEKSYIEVIYDEIVKVIGGDNPSQYFMMTFPAQVINPKDYEYDIENNAPKGPVVEANESRLANKLFDPCHITGADNGMMLSNQYKSALDVLTPRLDKKTAISKEKLRSLLLTKYPYDFGDGLTNNQTLQSVYFKLYDEYVEANRKWAELQDNEKSRIRQKYRSGSEEDNKKAKDEYLSWYETVAQSELTALNEKYSKVLSVFAPTDMDILEGVLDSGVGSELENAKRVMRNFAKQSPNGGDIYPVNFTPSNWFEYLANDTTSSIDLLNSPDELGAELTQLYVQKDMITKRLISMQSLVDEKADIDKINNDIKNAQSDLDKNYNNLFQGIGGNVLSVVKSVVNIAPALSSASSIKSIFDKLGAKVSDSDVSNFVNNITKNNNAISTAQNNINDATNKLANLYLQKLNAQTQKAYIDIVNELKLELDEITSKISDKTAKLKVSSLFNSSEGDTEPANPYAPPKGFTQILINVSGSSATSEQMSKSSSMVSNEQVWYLFGSSSKNSASSNKSIDQELQDSNTTIQVGMNVMKIGIEREWFNPGIFLLTKNMYNISKTRVSEVEKDGKAYHTGSEEFIKQIHNAKDSYILPCFPVAMVIARDVVIKYSTDSSSSSYIMNAMHEESTKGHSIFGFGKSESSVTDSNSSSSHSQMGSNSITIRFNSPQILGYYMEITPPDYSEMSDKSISGGLYENVDDYVDSYKKMLDEINEQLMSENEIKKSL